MISTEYEHNDGEIALNCWVQLLLGAAILIGGSAAQPSNAQDQSKIAAGAATFSEYCSTCHGDDLVSSGLTFDLRRLKTTDRPRFENSVLNGKNQMPPWRGVINAEQIDTLWSYIRANAFDK
jgi:mono/diheme cytochrome c family protein